MRFPAGLHPAYWVTVLAPVEFYVAPQKGARRSPVDTQPYWSVSDTRSADEDTVTGRSLAIVAERTQLGPTFERGARIAYSRWQGNPPDFSAPGKRHRNADLDHWT